MKKTIILFMVTLTLVISGCSSQKKLDADDEFSVEGDTGASTSGELDDLSLDEPSSTSNASAAEDDLSLDEPAPQASTAQNNGDLSDMDAALENELNSLDSEGSVAAQQPPQDELTLDEPVAANTAEQPVMAETPPPPAPLDLDADQPVVETPVAETPVAQNQVADVPPPAVSNDLPATINNVQYKGNENGGALTIKADQPLQFTTRFNSTTNQFIVEVQNSKIPQKLTRTLNTKDMASSIGSVDIYQKEGSNVARFVVQLRPGASEPIVQPEGNSLLVIGASVNGGSLARNNESPESQELGGGSGGAMTASSNEAPQTPEVLSDSSLGVAPEANSESMGSSDLIAAAPVSNKESRPKLKKGVLDYENLEDFLMGDQEFVGKKISIETSGMKLGDAITFLAEESGANIVIDSGVNLNDDVNIRLREIPWDQAFVMILKTKKLVYKRQGDVIRVTTLADLKRDEEDAIALKESRQGQEPLMVRSFYISYADIGELQTQIDQYVQSISRAKLKKGETETKTKSSVIVDKKNNTLIITDTEENLKSVAQIIKALDIQPKQVLIDTKIIVATETFQRSLGVIWETSGGGNTPNGTIRIDPGTASTTLDAAINWGQINFLGSLESTLRFGERKNIVKVLASPSITVLSNQQASITKTADIEATTTTSTTGTGTITTTTTKPIGLTLQVKPVVTNDNTVNLEIKLNRQIPNGVGADSSTADTKMYVKSGLTAVIGGIYESSNSDGVVGVPGLREIPVLGNLFQGRTKDVSKSELMMFITPTILKPL